MLAVGVFRDSRRRRPYVARENVKFTAALLLVFRTRAGSLQKKCRKF
jgi:hypothetical protein